MDAKPEFWIRVLLHKRIKTCSLKIAGPFQVLDAKTDNSKTYSEPILEPLSIILSQGRLAFAGSRFQSDELIISPGDPFVFTLNGSGYRGKLKLIVSEDGESFDAINLVPLEPYLAGVVGAEMPDYWEPAALQA